MQEPLKQSRFAPADRLPLEAVREQSERLLAIESATFVNSIPHIVMVLNSCRQIVFANDALVRYVGAGSLDEVLGMRPGEALGCMHANPSTGGCGTTEFCSQCGAVKAILDSLDGAISTMECRLLRCGEQTVQALDLQVAGSPFSLLGERCSIFSVMDVSHEKRRRALERTFFHDILNTAGGIKGLVDLLTAEAPEYLRGDADIIRTSVQHLIEEINSQRDITAAEIGELRVRLEEVRASDLLNAIAALYSCHEVAGGRNVRILDSGRDVVLTTDPRLAGRIIGNMVKNALEASRRGETVSVGFSFENDAVAFSVHNPGVMSPEARLCVFKRSFSTKGEGRGLGAFSMKLFAEGYLGGSVGFKSDERGGTVFTLRLPVNGADAARTAKAAK